MSIGWFERVIPLLLFLSSSIILPHAGQVHLMRTYAIREWMITSSGRTEKRRVLKSCTLASQI